MHFQKAHHVVHSTTKRNTSFKEIVCCDCLIEVLVDGRRANGSGAHVLLDRRLGPAAEVLPVRVRGNAVVVGVPDG